MPNISLSLLVLKTGQLERLRNFYSLLGLDFVQEQHGNGPVHYSAHAGETLIEIYPLESGIQPDYSTRLGFEVPDNLADVLERLSKAGFNTGQAKQTQWGYRAVVRDPDGRSVELYQRDDQR